MSFQELTQKVLEITEKAKNEKRILTAGERQQIQAYKYIFTFLKGTIEKEILSSLIPENQEAIKEYANYLDSEIQKYRKQFSQLVQASDNSQSTKKRDQKIALARGKLEKAMKDRDEFNFNYKHFVEEKASRQLKKYLDLAIIGLFNHFFLHRTSLITNENAFLISAVPPMLNYPNVNLALEVLKAKKTENLKHLIRLEEIEQALLNINLQEASKKGSYENQLYRKYKAEIAELEASIPENLRGANIHVLNLINYYCDTGLQRNDNDTPVFGSFVSSDTIDDNFLVNLTPEGEEATRSLKLAYDIDKLKGYSFLQIKNLFNKEDFAKIKDNLQEELDYMIGKH